MNYTIESIADFCSGQAQIAIPGSNVSNIIIDHRDIHWHGALFVALKGSRSDGHDFIPELIERGGRNFLITDAAIGKAHKGEANFIVVKDAVMALQEISKEHRDNYKIPIVGVAGSNGKTIVKEWINSLLEASHQVCRSPKSYNSQIGVALSLMQLGSKHTLGVFEAGISKPGEMALLQQMIAPSIGIFTNLGDAHAAHFDSYEQKLMEKLKLFAHSNQVIVNRDQFWFAEYNGDIKDKFFTWSRESTEADVCVNGVKVRSGSTIIDLNHDNRQYQIQIPFEDRASIENAIHCFCLCLILDCVNQQALKRFSFLAPVAMRMEMKQGVENSILIDDSYNSDLGSLQAALDQLASQKAEARVVILTDMYQNSPGDYLYHELASILNESRVDELICIGPDLEKYRSLFTLPIVQNFENADQYWEQLDTTQLRNKAILVKGARAFRLEKLVQRLQAQQHETTLQVDLHKLGQNLKYFRSQIESKTKIMVMVKAFSYGSGGFEVANYLQNQKVDYLAVAYADEGVSLRKRGVRLPIMVMSPAKTSYDAVIRHQLEPEIYSLRSLKEFIESAASLRHLFHELNIHLKIDSGMHRLGFESRDVPELLELLNQAPFIRVASVFTHLSAVDSEYQDEFTKQQIERYQSVAAAIQLGVNYQVMNHVLNSTGVLRFPQYHFDMVRIGIGLYGFAGTDSSKFLQALGAFKSYIIQIRTVAPNESVGYSRAGVSDKERRIATIAVGYADGLDRRLGHGEWSLKWQGQACPIVGNVCMDMCMIDVTHCEAKEGDEIMIFEGADDVSAMAKKLGTIPYEILTKVSQRVSRVYLQE